MQGTRLQCLVQEDPTCCAVTKPTALGPVLYNKRSHRDEKPMQLQLEKATCSREDSAQTKGNKLKIVPSCDPEIPCLGIYQDRTTIQKDRCTLCVYNSQDLEAT